MRHTLFVVKHEAYKTFDAQLDQIAEKFSIYLDEYYQSKNEQGSKHGKMGPVGKVLSKLRRNQSIESIKGEMLRIHEMTSKRLTLLKMNKAKDLIEEALDELAVVLKQTPLSKHANLLSDIDNRIYWKLERKIQIKVQEKYERFIFFLKNRFSEMETLNEELNTNFTSWENVPYPTEKYKENEHMEKFIKEFRKMEEMKGEKEQ